jgi:glycosyltransferase involved in cell wall biosynthesis
MAARTLRIGYLLNTFPSSSQTFVANEVRALREYGAELVLFALRPELGQEAGPGSVIYGRSGVGNLRRRLSLSLRGAARAMRAEKSRMFEAALVVRHLGAARRFARAARRLGVTHVHAQSAWLPLSLAFAVARMEPVTVSFSCHARDLFVLSAGLREKLSRACLCIACTAVGADHVRALALPQDRHKVKLIYHGTDLEMFTYDPPGPLGDPPLILAAGRMVPKKGFDVLLRACALLRDRRPFRCEVYGRGHLAPALLRLREALGLGDVVAFPGWATYEAMPALCRRADVLAVPSVPAPDGDRDGLPNVAVEALAAGTPVVASRFTALPEAVVHEETGLLCPPGDPHGLADALDRMLGDAELRRHVAEKGRRLAEERFDFRRNARSVLDALRSAAGPAA